MAGFTNQDLGACNCGGCTCTPCDLPGGTLHFSTTWPTQTPAYSGTGPMAYSQAASVCTWLSGCVDIGTGVLGHRYVVTKFVCDQSTGCCYFLVNVYAVAGCTSSIGNFLWESSAGCSGITPGTTLHLISSTCGAGLNLYFSTSAINPSGGDQFTITL